MDRSAELIVTLSLRSRSIRTAAELRMVEAPGVAPERPARVFGGDAVGDWNQELKSLPRDLILLRTDNERLDTRLQGPA